MKRKILIFLAIVCFVPSFVLAGTCSTPIISGGGSSQASGGSPGSGCDDSVCLSTSGGKYVGVRIQLYKYSGGNVTLVGKGVDIWGTSGLNSSSYHFSSPSTANLTTKASCTKGTGSNAYGKNLSSIYSLSSSNYLSGNYGTVTYDTNLQTKYDNGTTNDYLLVYSNGTPKSGWLKTNLLDKLIADTTTANQNLKDLFGLTETQIADIRANSDDYYISAEMLYRFWLNNISSNRYTNNYGGKTDHYYLGTASEGGYLHGYIGIYKALYQDKNVGSLVSSTGKIKTVSSSSLRGKFFNDNTDGINRLAACNSGYGMNIWNLGAVCEDCGVPTCEQTCSGTDVGTTERLACATAYCNANDSGSSACISACSTLSSDNGCDSKYDGKCATYTKNGTVTVMGLNNEKCDTYTDSTKKTLSSKVCYDDESAYTVVNDNGTNSTIADYSKTNKIYYKIECYESLELSDLPTKKTVYLSESNNASLYLGYKMKYSKKCTLYYKKKNTTNQWSTNYNDSQLKKDINTYTDIITNKKYPVNMTDATERATYLQVMQAALDEIKNVKANAIKRLENISDKNYSNSENGSQKAELKVATKNGSSYTTETLILEPVYCSKSDDLTDEKKCTLESHTYYKKTNAGTYQCTDKDGNPTTATIIKDTSTGSASSSYEETIYMGLPSSYIAASSSVAGNVYRDKQACLTAVKADNGYCIEEENVFVFNELDETVSINLYNNAIGSEAMNVSISGYGSCGQFEYDLKCDYDYSAKGKCAKCLEYTYGTIEYNQCIDKYCDCEAYCGSNVSCLAKYCRTDCPECDDDEIVEPCGPDNKCLSKCTSTNLEEKITCEKSCCQLGCAAGDDSCSTRCCVSACEALYAGNNAKIAACVNNTCDCLNGNCGGDYYYRTIDQDRPFPGGTGLTREPGANWYNKVEFITDSAIEQSKYKDTTDGRYTNIYEYKITLTSDDIKRIKNDSSLNTTYTNYKKSSRVDSIKGDKVYCSYVLHDYLYNLGIELEIGSNVNSGSGCGV